MRRSYLALNTAWMPSCAGPSAVKRLLFTGEPVDAERAERIGLVNYVVAGSELDAKTDWLVARVANKSPTAIRRGKAMMRAAA